jgi:prophage endopeptidase
MLKLTNPWVLLGIIAIVVASFFKGRDYEHMLQQAEILRLNGEMAVIAEASAINLHKEKQNAQEKIDQLRADVRSGTVRLSVPVRAVCDPSIAGGNTEARAELDPKVSEDLIAITADGDQAIIELNTCIDQYNKIRDTK